MLLNNDRAKCCGCGACMEADQKKNQVIGMDRDSLYFYYAMHSVSYSPGDEWKKVCPYYSLKEIDLIERESYCVNEALGYEIYNKIAAKILTLGGVVYGLSVNSENTEAACKGVWSCEQIAELNAPHKVQSTAFIYSEVEEVLKSGKRVLFSGMPCEIDGLRLFLREDYENLICIGFRCTGVASPRLWREYLSYRELKAGGKVEKLQMISSRKGESLHIIFDNGKVYDKKVEKDLFFKMVNSGTGIRVACKDCTLRTDHRISDIELGENTSVVAVNTYKGKELILDMFSNLEGVCDEADDSKVRCRLEEEESEKKIVDRLESWPHGWFLRHYARENIKD